MSGMQTAVFAIFLQFNSIFQSFFILLGKIINSFALRALHFYHVILRHIDTIIENRPASI